jgi:hypothetical protein
MTWTIGGEPLADRNVPFGPTDQELIAHLKAEIDGSDTGASLSDFMNEPGTKTRLKRLPQGAEAGVRAYAKERFMALSGKLASAQD